MEKEVPFQGRTERWSNVYCMDMTDVSVAAHESIQDAVLAAERPVHAAAVKFVRTRVYTVKGLNGFTDTGDMFSVMERNVLGTAPTSTYTPYRECAVLVKWPLNRKTKIGGGLGRQRSLKKWIRATSSGQINQGNINGSEVLSETAKQQYRDYSAAILNVANGNLCSPDDGAEPSDTVRIHDYIEHRQFPRGRKES